MRYAIVGAGAIGGTVAGYLARAGQPLLLVDADAEHVRAMQQRGLTIRGFDETFSVPVDAVTPDQLPDSLDAVLLAVKAPATEAAVRSFEDRLAPDGYVVSLQNGLNELLISQLVGAERAIGAFVNFSADYLEPGLIHFGGRGTFVIGELDGSLSPRLYELQRVLGAWGHVQVTDNIWGYLWGKQAYGAMLFATALTNDSMADAIEGHRALMVDLANEVLRVARSIGVTPLGFDGFEPDVLAAGNAASIHDSLDRLIAIRKRDEKTHSGVWRDLAIRKRRTEVDAHFLPIVAEAERHGVTVARLRRLIELIHDIENGQREFESRNLDELAHAAPAVSA
ncbi:MAG TPA: 2-dehydropantoate 2-reductase [Chloroflexota bacterium]|jgi:2-dehydropantoate 2-reductase|nr:2-dehydropantoate 2-reductase [Chloroflexota bacterium]